MSCPMQAAQDGITLRKTSDSLTTPSPTTSNDEGKRVSITNINTFNRIRMKLKTIPWERLKHIKWKNERVTQPGMAYMPTEIEHIANVISHGIWVIPAIYAAMQLLFRSQTSTQFLAAIIYGTSLSSLFAVSTCFHSAFYCMCHTPVKDVLHRCDRAMIYIFIAGSYYPWLSLGDPLHPTICFVFKWAIWILAAMGILYQQLYHERFKTLETVFYVIMGLGPSVVIMLYGHEFVGMSELKLGGLIYILGIVFFKADGLIPFAHSIWHLFVVLAAAVHYYAIFNYLYSN